MPLEHVHEAVVAHQLRIRVGGDLLLEAHQQVAAVVHHVPHLRLPKTYAALCSEGVIGMHLERQVVVGVDELDEQRELLPVDLVQGLSGKGAFGDTGFTLPVTGDHPVLAAPHHGPELCRKLQNHFALP